VVIGWVFKVKPREIICTRRLDKRVNMVRGKNI